MFFLTHSSSNTRKILEFQDTRTSENFKDASIIQAAKRCLRMVKANLYNETQFIVVLDWPIRIDIECLAFNFENSTSILRVNISFFKYTQIWVLKKSGLESTQIVFFECVPFRILRQITFMKHIWIRLLKKFCCAKLIKHWKISRGRSYREELMSHKSIDLFYKES